jgi:hypothetical protein
MNSDIHHYKYVESVVMMLNNEDQLKIYQSLKRKFDDDLPDFDQLIQDISTVSDSDNSSNEQPKPLFIQQNFKEGRKYILSKILRDGDIVYNKNDPDNKSVYSQLQNCLVCQNSGRLSYSFSGIIKNKTGIRKNIVVVREGKKYHLQLLNLQGKNRQEKLKAK